MVNRGVRTVYLIVFASVCLFFVLALGASAATYTVNSTEDSDDGTCVDPYVDAASDCTLEEAIDAANANVGADTINFSIDAAFADDGDGQWTISYTGVLPDIDDPVTLTAVSVWDSDDDRPGIKLSSTESSEIFLHVTTGSSASKVQGLEIVSGATVFRVDASDGVIVGTDCDGTTDSTERNVIYNSGGVVDLQVSTGATNFEVKGNYIGVLSDGITGTGTANFGLHILGDAGPGTIGYEEGQTCTVAESRNIIGAQGQSGWGNAITVEDTASVIRIHGNYIGLGSDGVSDICGTVVSGVNVIDTADQVYIGTDGDNVNDDSEGNVMSACNHGAKLTGSPTNVRVSGNIIGFQSDGVTAKGNDARGVVARAANVIVGWCDTSVDSDICSDSGTLANQANQIGFNGTDGIFMANGSDTVQIFGNYIGTDSAGTANYGNTVNGILIEQPDISSTLTIGGTGSNKPNIINYNGGAGVYIDGAKTGNAEPATENYSVVNNTISNNAVNGVHIVGTDFYGTEGPNDGSVTDNTISSNTGDGIYLEGSSPLVQDNTFTSNTSYGVRLLSMFEPTKGAYTNPYEALSPQNADRDAVSTPNITGNTFNTNTLGGIYMLDASANNAATLSADNTINTNGSVDVRQDWYASVEVLDIPGDTITRGEVIPVLTPAGGVACTGTCIGDAHGSLSSTQGVWGPTSIDYDDATAWYTVTDYIIDDTGTTVSYNPYTIEVLGSNQIQSYVTSYTFDGDSSDDTSAGQLVSGYNTGSNNIHRYQTAEVTIVPRRASLLTRVQDLIGLLSPEDRQIKDDILDQIGNIGEGDEVEQIHGSPISTDTPGSMYGNGHSGEMKGHEYTNGLGGGDEEDILIAGGLVITEKVFRMMAPGSVVVKDGFVSVFPFAFASFLFLGGFVHSVRLRKRLCTTKKCQMVYSTYATAGMVAGALIFAGLSSYQNTYWANAAGDMERVYPYEMSVAEGDTLRFEYTIENVSEESYVDLVWHDVFSRNLLEDPDSITVFKNNRFLNTREICLRNVCTTQLGDVVPGDEFNMDIHAVVGDGDRVYKDTSIYINRMGPEYKYSTMFSVGE